MLQVVVSLTVVLFYICSIFLNLGHFGGNSRNSVFQTHIPLSAYFLLQLWVTKKHNKTIVTYCKLRQRSHMVTFFCVSELFYSVNFTAKSLKSL